MIYIKKYYTAFLVFIFIFIPINVFAKTTEITILFTSDLHSNISEGYISDKGSVYEVGGFARLATVIKENRTKNTLVLDSGDFSMGTLFQTLYRAKAPEIFLMSQMGYDAVALGNHEFDMGYDAFIDFLNVAKPYNIPLLASNTNNSGDKTIHLENKDNPLADKGVLNYIIKEIDGKKVGIFSLIGSKASNYIFIDNYSFLDVISYSKQMVKKLKSDGCDAIVVLSHCGTEGIAGKTEDEKLASQVDGIDLIISGHSHSFEEPITVNNTVIFSPGAYGAFLCKATLTIGEDKNTITTSKDNMIPVNFDIVKDTNIEKQVESFKEEIQLNYLNKVSPELSMDTKIAYSPFTTEDMNTIEAKLGNYQAGDIITDSFRYSLKKLADIDDIDVSIEPVGVVRAPFYKGIMTTSEVYKILSYGTSNIDQLSGSSLGVYYIKGEDFYDLCEVDISISPIMSAAQLFLSGVEYDYVSSRLPFNKVSAVRIFNKNTNKFEEIDKQKLYKVAVTTSTANLVSVVGKKSFGLLDIKLYNQKGELLKEDEIDKQIVMYKDEYGKRELKEWYALATYLKSFETDIDNLPQISSSYNTARLSKIEIINPKLQDYFTNINKVPIILLSIIIVLILLAIFIYKKIKK